MKARVKKIFEGLDKAKLLAVGYVVLSLAFLIIERSL